MSQPMRAPIPTPTTPETIDHRAGMAAVIATLCKVAKAEPAATLPMAACHAAADEPASGPRMPKPAAERAGRATIETTKTHTAPPTRA